MSKVTIEGSRFPSTYLATGQRLTVERTPFISNLIRRGYATVIQPARKPAAPDPVPVQETMAEVSVESEITAEPARLERQVTAAPSKSATRSTWLEFLDEQGVAYPEDATRAQLIDRWEDVSG